MVLREMNVLLEVHGQVITIFVYQMTSKTEDEPPLKMSTRTRIDDDLIWAIVLGEVNDGLYLRG